MSNYPRAIPKAMIAEPEAFAESGDGNITRYKS